MTAPAAVLNLAEAGFPVFPLGKDKRPIIPKAAGGNGFKDATTDIEQIERWAAKYPGCLWGVPTGKASGFDALDVDAEPMARTYFHRAGVSLPDGDRTYTPSGGFHLLFRHDSRVTNQSEKRGTSKGWDVRGEGGYVVVPPSLGYRYHGFAGLTETWEPQPWPPALLDAVLAAKAPKAKSKTTPGTLEPRTHADGTPAVHETALEVTKLLVRAGFPAEEAAAAAEAVNAEQVKRGARELEPGEALRAAEGAEAKGYGPEVEVDPDDVEPYAGITGPDLRDLPIPPRREAFPGVAYDERVLVAGAPGAGKSLFACYWAVTDALGEKLFGEYGDGKPRRTVLLLEEDPLRTSLSRLRRLVAWYGQDWRAVMENVLLLSRIGFFAQSAADRARLIRTLRDFKPDRMLVDSVAQTSGIRDFSNGADVKAYFRLMDPLEDYVEQIGYLHHTTKGVHAKVQTVGDSALVLGSVQFEASVDACLLLRKSTKDRGRLLSGTKFRDSEEDGSGLKFAYYDDPLGPMVEGRPSLGVRFEGVAAAEEVSASTGGETIATKVERLLRDNPDRWFGYVELAKLAGDASERTVREAVSGLGDAVERQKSGGRGKQASVKWAAA